MPEVALSFVFCHILNTRTHTGEKYGNFDSPCTGNRASALTSWLHRQAGPRLTICANSSNRGLRTWRITISPPMCWNVSVKGKNRCIPPPTSGKTLAWTIEYTDTAKSLLRKLDKQTARRIVDDMDERIAPLDDPRSAGKSLTGPMGELGVTVSGTAG